MPRAAIGTTNIGLRNPLNTLIGGSPVESLYDIRVNSTYPVKSAPFTNLAVSAYAQATGQFLYNIGIKSNNGSWGVVNIPSPWSENGGANTNTIGTTKQAYSYTYTTIQCVAVPTYPRTFARWQIDQTGGTYSTSTQIFVGFGDSIITNSYSLTAIFQ